MSIIKIIIDIGVVYMNYSIDVSSFVKSDGVYLYNMITDKYANELSEDTTIFINLGDYDSLDNILCIHIEPHIKYIYIIGSHSKEVVISSTEEAIIYVEKLTGINILKKPSIFITSEHGKYCVTVSSILWDFLAIGEYILYNNKTIHLNHAIGEIMEYNIAECPQLSELNLLVGYMV